MKTSIKKLIKNYISQALLGDRTFHCEKDIDIPLQNGREHFDWIRSDIVGLVEAFVQENRLCDSAFIKGMNSVFKTKRFDSLLKKWICEYMIDLLNAMDSFSRDDLIKSGRLVLDDNPINRYAFEKFSSRFKIIPKIKWVRRRNTISCIFVIFFQALFVLYFSLNSGIAIFRAKKKYKVMRELVWGFYPTGGYYFHDDFLVDEKSIKKDDLLLFSRKDIKQCEQRNKAYQQAKMLRFNTFYLPSLKISFATFFFRVIPLYLVGGMGSLSAEISSANFSLFSRISRYFISYALPYEKIFSNYEIGAELGYSFYSSRHIPEAIVCQNMKTRYYLAYGSDMSSDSIKYSISFLGCDKYFAWGAANALTGREASDIFIHSGYIFKRFINNVKFRRSYILSEMGIHSVGKVVTFFDESFGGGSVLKAEHYVNFWKTALELAVKEPKLTVIMKSKELSRYHELPRELRDRFLEIKKRIEELGNAHIIDEKKWSFIECIGVSDIVVTESMTSSATIAIICGIEGLYLDEAELDHPFSRILKDKAVFKESDKLLKMIRDISNGEMSVLSEIPKDLIRRIDEYPDDRGIDVLRAVLTGSGSGAPHN